MQKPFTKRIRQMFAFACAVFTYSVFSQNALAHTTVQPNSYTEAASQFVHISAPHGCNGLPIRAMSILFPGENSTLTENGTATTFNGQLAPGSSHASPRLAQNKDVFRTSKILSDTNGVRKSFQWTNGFLKIDHTGAIPVRMTFPKFDPASCADTLRIRYPIGNWCSKSTNVDDDDRADIWVGANSGSTLFNDPDVDSSGSDFWPTVTIHRDVANNPLPDPENCPNGTTTLDWRPTGAEIDQYLPIQGYWPTP